MVGAIRRAGVARGVGLLAVTAAVVALSLAGCQLFTTTPFPAFVDKTDISIDLSSRINSIAAGKGISSYDLEVVTDPQQVQPTMVLLVAVPPSTDSSGAYKYTGKIIFMDQDLNVLGEASTKTTLDYFVKPYAYAATGEILAGYTVLTLTGAPGSATLPATGLEGFAFANNPAAPPTPSHTYVFAVPSGQYSSFDLARYEYDNNWGILSGGTLPIVDPTSSDRNDSTLGYQLVGLSYDWMSDVITFILSQPGTGKIVATRVSRPLATGASPPPLLALGASWPVSVNVDRPAVSVDGKGMFLVRRDGWMDRYTWTQAPPGAPAAGSPTEIVGDRSLTRQYAFLVDQTGSGPSYMYRFDPSSRVLTRYKEWW